MWLRDDVVRRVPGAGRVLPSSYLEQRKREGRKTISRVKTPIHHKTTLQSTGARIVGQLRLSLHTCCYTSIGPKRLEFQTLVNTNTCSQAIPKNHINMLLVRWKFDFNFAGFSVMYNGGTTTKSMKLVGAVPVGVQRQRKHLITFDVTLIELSIMMQSD